MTPLNEAAMQARAVAVVEGAIDQLVGMGMARSGALQLLAIQMVTRLAIAEDVDALSSLRAFLAEEIISTRNGLADTRHAH